MSTTAALLKLPCIPAATLAIHTSLIVPGNASKDEKVSVRGLESKLVGFGLMISSAIKVSKTSQASLYTN